MTVAILDIDGTLVDTNYQHAVAWYRAFRRCGIVVQVWRIHRHIGMGGDQLVAALTDERTERERGDEIRGSETGYYRELIGEVAPMDGSRELIEELDRRGHTVVLASSAKPEEVDHYLDLLDARPLARAWTTAGDVSATKPDPDLIMCALQKAEASAEDAIMVGDSAWDVRAASKAQVPTLAVMTGGFAREELVSAGAEKVFLSVAQLREELDSTRLR
ncbi:MAG: HAD family hydrolase [Actinobacteria bacterium]|nr:MAG: HAD family hydrolase [Actinomycetota bacterium]